MDIDIVLVICSTSINMSQFLHTATVDGEGALPESVRDQQTRLVVGCLRLNTPMSSKEFIAHCLLWGGTS